MMERYVSTGELKRLVSAFLAVLIGLSLLALFAAIVVPGLRNANKPLFPSPQESLQGRGGWLDPAEYPPARGYTLPPVDPKTVMTPSSALLANGRDLFARSCAACHGEAGRGDGPAARGMNPPPRDLTRPEGWKNGSGIVGVFKTVSEGLPGTQMAPFDAIRPVNRMALVHHVRALGAFPEAPEDPAALRALAKKFASAGERVPPRIPVSTAAAALIKEFRRPAGLRAGAALDEIWDRERAALTLRGTRGWRANASALARAVAPGVPGNGFAVGCLQYDAAQWADLHRRLRSALP
ncbi:MAG: cytochrome c [Elusimicrobiota bacterium]